MRIAACCWDSNKDGFCLNIKEFNPGMGFSSLLKWICAGKYCNCYWEINRRWCNFFSFYNNKIKMIVEACLPHRRDFVDKKKKKNPTLLKLYNKVL